MAHAPLVADAVLGEDENLGGTVVRKTPWWALSTGMHLVLALVLGWF